MSMDPAEPRPEVRAIAAYPLTEGDVLLSLLPSFSLEEAEQLHRLGWIVLIDPDDEELLARWEQTQRAWKRRWNW